MENMICFDCVLKHLATALSYGKQILSGHSLGNDLDHRIDFLGQLVNAEHHLQLINLELFTKVADFRKALQSKKMLVTFEDLEKIRSFYLDVQFLQDGNLENINYKIQLPIENVDIVYKAVTNLENFDLSYKSVKKYGTYINKIFVLQSDVDLSKYEDVEVLNMDILQACKSDKLKDDLVILSENMGILKETDFRKIAPSFSSKGYEVDADSRIFIKGILKSDKVIYNYDNIKPQPLTKKTYVEVMQNLQYHGKDFLTVFYTLSKIFVKENYITVTVTVNRNICCSTKSELQRKKFVLWTENGFLSLKDYLKLD